MPVKQEEQFFRKKTPENGCFMLQERTIFANINRKKLVR